MNEHVVSLRSNYCYRFSTNENCKIGKGGYGQVVMGHRCITDAYRRSLREEKVAVKILGKKIRKSNDKNHEAAILAELNGNNAMCHIFKRNIMKMYDLFTWRDHHCIASPLYGPSLRAMINNENNIGKYCPYEIISSIFNQLTTGVGYIHMMNIVHLDLKPDNIVFDSCQIIKNNKNNNGNNFWDRIPKCPHIRIIDFGLSRHMNDKSPCNVGTRAYQSPEMITQIDNKNITSATDVWAIGCILLELVSGCSAFKVNDKNRLDTLKAIRMVIGDNDMAKEYKEWIHEQEQQEQSEQSQKSPQMNVKSMNAYLDDYNKCVMSLQWHGDIEPALKILKDNCHNLLQWDYSKRPCAVKMYGCMFISQFKDGMDATWRELKDLQSKFKGDFNIKCKDEKNNLVDSTLVAITDQCKENCDKLSKKQLNDLNNKDNVNQLIVLSRIASWHRKIATNLHQTQLQKMVNESKKNINNKKKKMNDDGDSSVVIQCKHCPKKFKTKREHAAHESDHANGRPIACHICHKRFINLNQHKEHYNKHHM